MRCEVAPRPGGRGATRVGSAPCRSLCVLLWAQPGMEDALSSYEDKVLSLVDEHEGRVLQRAVSDGSAGRPHEIQMITFASQEALDRYLGDERRLEFAGNTAVQSHVPTYSDQPALNRVSRK